MIMIYVTLLVEKRGKTLGLGSKEIRLFRRIQLIQYRAYFEILNGKHVDHLLLSNFSFQFASNLKFKMFLFRQLSIAINFSFPLVLSILKNANMRRF